MDPILIGIIHSLISHRPIELAGQRNRQKTGNFIWRTKRVSRKPPSTTAPVQPRSRAAFAMISPQWADSKWPSEDQTETVSGLIRSSMLMRISESSLVMSATGYPWPVKAGPATTRAVVTGAM